MVPGVVENGRIEIWNWLVHYTAGEYDICWMEGVTQGVPGTQWQLNY